MCTSLWTHKEHWLLSFHRTYLMPQDKGLFSLCFVAFIIYRQTLHGKKIFLPRMTWRIGIFHSYQAFSNGWCKRVFKIIGTILQTYIPHHFLYAFSPEPITPSNRLMFSDNANAILLILAWVLVWVLVWVSSASIHFISKSAA